MNRCELCRAELNFENISGFCRECMLIMEARTGIVLEEWRTHPGGVYVASDRGRIARLLAVNRAHRYPRVSIGGRMIYVHQVVAEAWHGPRPAGQLVLHADDDPDNPAPSNLRFGDHLQNAADRERNRKRRAGAPARKDQP